MHEKHTDQPAPSSPSEVIKRERNKHGIKYDDTNGKPNRWTTENPEESK